MLDDRGFSSMRSNFDCVRSSYFPRWILPCVVAAALHWCGSPSDGADRPPEVEASIRRGVDYLTTNQATIAPYEAGIVAYSLMSAGETPENALVKSQLELVLKKFSSTYKPGIHHNYEAGVDAMALVAADREKYKGQIQLIAEFLIREQRPHGGWDYAGNDYQGDTSISQYGMLGLWAAQRAGFQVPARVWDESAQWHIRTQLREGSFGYHPLSGDADPKHSMTVAGVGTLAIAKLMLSKLPQAEPDLSPKEKELEPKPKKNDKAFGVLERVNPTEAVNRPGTAAAVPEGVFKQKSGRKQLDDHIGRGMGWLTKFYTVEKPTGWHLYYLYGLERVASLTNTTKINGHDWYKEGCDILIKKQSPNGAFNDLGGGVSATCFAILFMTRATEKLVPVVTPPPPKPKEPTFGGGLLAGGRGLPTDLANVDTKDGNVTAKKTDTPLDKLLAELENPKSQKVESAQAALVEAVQVGQREQLIGQKELLLKLAKDARVDVRRTAFWALARCNDLRVAPVLIQGLMDPDFDAAVEARNALCVLSRRPRGFGLPDDLIAKLPEGASQAEKDSAFEKWRDDDIRRWRDWYQSVRPYSERDKLPD